MEWIPRYIKQTSTRRPGQIITADDWNELFNLVIGQGDYTAEGLVKAIAAFNQNFSTKADLIDGKVPMAQIPDIFKPEGLGDLTDTVAELSQTVPENNTQINTRCSSVEEHIITIMMGGV